MGKPVGQRFIVTSENRGFSLIEVVVVVAVMALAITSLSFLFLRVNLTKSANEKLLTASTLAEDILEHVRETSINGFSDLTDLIVDGNTRVFGPDDTDDSDGFSLLISKIYEGETLPAAFYTLRGANSLSYITFEVKERNLFTEKLLTTVVIRWKEIGRSVGEQGREYSLFTYITKYGLKEFIK